MKDPVLRLLITELHLRALHAGPTLTLSLLREEFWILRARSVVRSVLYRCVPCTRERAAIPAELMGNLPDVRVNRTAHAFMHTGVDYAGPILLRTAPGRNHKSHKAYIALFICMTTKAIHLELVSDYSTNAFLAAFNRIVSRRGLPASMYSDNDTTFKGADRELQVAFKASSEDLTVLNIIVSEGGAWHFIPPSAPHFGGLWKIAVRSMKHHLKCCIGAHTLTFEEFTTVLCRVEACLNSRPIAPISDNLADHQVLTPGYFLIGGQLLSVPEPSVLDLKEASLSRWQLLQQITESVWKS